MQVPIRKPGKYTHLKPDPNLTEAKFEELKKKLERLKTVEQPKTITEMSRLAQDGDFSENAGYQIAKGKLRAINQLIHDLEDHLGRAVIINPNDERDTVQLGHLVTLDIQGVNVRYRILGSSETDPERGVISDRSPIGASLMGKKVNDVVRLKQGDGEIEARIVSIS